MSFDPFGHQEPTLSASGGPPGSPLPGESGDPSAQAEALYRQAREKVTLPAVFLVIMGALNLLWGGYLIVNAIFTHSRTPEQMQKILEQQNPNMRKQLEAQGYTMRDIQNIAVYGGGGTGVAVILASLLLILGGIRMLQLRNYGLAIFSSVVAAVPFISCMACCCMGEVVGVWSIVVLLTPQVRMMFR
jgi:hypothetical protein